MSLFKREITYDTLRLVKDMMELSEFRRIEYDQEFGNSKLGLGHDMYLTGFSMGRRSGHTDAAIEYALDNKGVFIVTHNEPMRRHVIERMNFLLHSKYGSEVANSEKERLFSFHQSMVINVNRVRGTTIDLTGKCYKNGVRFIFDEVKREDVYDFMNIFHSTTRCPIHGAIVIGSR